MKEIEAENKMNELDDTEMPHLSPSYLRQAKAYLKEIKRNSKAQKEGRIKQEQMANGYTKIMNFMDRNIHKDISNK